MEKHNKTEKYVQLSCTLNINGFKSFHNFCAMTFKSLPEVPLNFYFPNKKKKEKEIRVLGQHKHLDPLTVLFFSTELSLWQNHLRYLYYLIYAW